jgi:tetratricopeptide (TPR) repeat protein
MVAVTGQVSRRELVRAPLVDPDNGSLTGGHELLRSARKIIRECNAGMLCCDALTYQMIRDVHYCNRLRDLSSTMSNVPIYEVRSSAGTTDVTYEPPLCGRSKELSYLDKTFLRVERGEGPVFLTVTGDLGIGKSRLVREFIKKVQERCVVFKNPRERRRIDRWRRIPYSYFGEILRSAFDIYDKENAQISRRKLINGIEQIFPRDSGSDIPQDIVRFIGMICQVDIPASSEQPEEDNVQLEQRAFAVFSRYLEWVAHKKPVIFVLEDLYSADHSSLRLFKHITRTMEPARVLFICVSRLDLLTNLEEEAELKIPGERLILQPLDRDMARRMFEQLLFDDVHIPETLVQRILDLAEGNPFFLRESLRHLIEENLPQDAGSLDLEKIEIPRSIEGILQARISRLSTRERDVLQKASIFGKSFWRGGVEMLYRHEADLQPGWRIEDGTITDREDDLEQLLEGLAHKGVIQYQADCDFEGESQYAFIPGLLSEIAYNEIPKALLAPYHRLVGQWLELMAQRRNSDISIEIAHHFDLGGDHTHAAHYHIDIAIRSFKLYATQRAIEHFALGLQHLDRKLLQKRTKALRQLAESYILNGQYKEAIEQLEELLDISWRMGQRLLAGETYIRIGWVHYLMRDFDNALKFMKNGHTLHQETMYNRGIATALSKMGQVYMVMGDYAQARLYFEEALQMRRELSHPSDLAWALNNMGNLLWEQGDLEGSQRNHQEALEIRKNLGNPHQIIQSMNNLSLIHMTRGDYDAALADLIVISNLAQKVGEKLGMAIVTINIGELYLLRGETDKVDKYLRQAMQLSERLGDPMLQAETLRLRGELLLEQGDGLAALDCCGRAYQLIMQRGIRSALSQIYRLMGEVYAALSKEVIDEKGKIGGDRAGLPPFLFGNALACYEESIALAHRHGNVREEAKSRMLMGIYEVNRGNIARGRYQLERAQASFERLGMQRDCDEIAGLLQEIESFRRSQIQPDASPTQSPESAQTTLRPPRSKMANVDKTIVFRVNFDENEIGPPPTPVDIDAEETQHLDSIFTHTATTSSATTLPPEQEKEASLAPPAPLPDNTKGILPIKPTLPPAFSSEAISEEQNIAPSTTKAHTLEVQSPLYSISGKYVSEGNPSTHTLTSHLAITSYLDQPNSQLSDESKIADNLTTMPEANKSMVAEQNIKQDHAHLDQIQIATPIAQALPTAEEYPEDTKPSREMPNNADQIPLASEPSDDEIERPSVLKHYGYDSAQGDLSDDSEDLTVSMHDDGMMLETIDVVDDNLTPIPKRPSAHILPTLKSSPEPSPLQRPPAPLAPPAPVNTTQAHPTHTDTPGATDTSKLGTSEASPQLEREGTQAKTDHTKPTSPHTPPQEIPAASNFKRTLPFPTWPKDFVQLTSPKSPAGLLSSQNAAHTAPAPPIPDQAKTIAVPAPKRTSSLQTIASTEKVKSSESTNPSSNEAIQHQPQQAQAIPTIQSSRTEAQHPVVELTDVKFTTATSTSQSVEDESGVRTIQKAAPLRIDAKPEITSTSDIGDGEYINDESSVPSSEATSAEQISSDAIIASEDAGICNVQRASPQPEAEVSGGRTVQMPSPKRTAQIQVTPPSTSTPSADGSQFPQVKVPPADVADIPSEMDLLNIPQSGKKLTVYDSQVIIAQVAEDDAVSRRWFEIGRSDRSRQFWREHPEEREEVTQELIHEQVIEELDKLAIALKTQRPDSTDPNSPPKK